MNNEQQAKLYFKILTHIKKGTPKYRVEEIIGFKFEDEMVLLNYCTVAGCKSELNLKIFYDDIKYLSNNLKSKECDHYLNSLTEIKKLTKTQS